MEEIGWDPLSGRFVDNGLRFIRSVFKLYPWEWLTTDLPHCLKGVGGAPIAGHVLDTLDNGGGTGSTLWIEPAWKMLLSNKALLAILWELYPGHPNLLPAYLDGPRELAAGTGYVAKPLLGREGEGVTVHEPGPSPSYATNPAATRRSPRCPPSTATTSSSAPGSSRTSPRASASGSRPGWSPTSTPASCRT
jgi:glutathionylspermidine synthase